MLVRHWTCGCCGKQFDSVPLDFAYDCPAYWHGIPKSERASRGKLGSDLCRADEYTVVRGCIEIPIIGLDERFVWGVWVSVSEESFERILELWKEEDLADEPPRFGWLNNSLPNYPDTLSLKTHIHVRSGNLRPAVELEPTDHPLAVEQREGITIERLEEIVASLMQH
jgi:hypothetical protein